MLLDISLTTINNNSLEFKKKLMSIPRVVLKYEKCDFLKIFCIFHTLEHFSQMNFYANLLIFWTIVFFSNCTI